MKGKLDARVAALEANGCSIIRSESGSGSSLEGRTELGTIPDFIRPGEKSVVMRIERSAPAPRRELQITAAKLKERSAQLAASEQLVDTLSATGKAFFNMLGAAAACETNLGRNRQTEGISAARQRGVYLDPPRKIGMDANRHLLAEGPPPAGIVRDPGISRGTVYKAKDTSGEHDNPGSGPCADFCRIQPQKT